MTSIGEEGAARVIRVATALDSIQEALQHIEHAIQALSGVDGMILERKKVNSLSDELTRTWFAVGAAANRLCRKRRFEPPRR
jgi:hypothetical protein